RSGDVERLVAWIEEAAGPLTDLLLEHGAQAGPETVTISGAVPRVLREALATELTARVAESDLDTPFEVVCGEVGRFAAAEGAARQMLTRQMLRATG
ncbi:MAG: hypothetical protein AAFQ51_14870, partial [Pseudomonadota bacterium]